MLVYTSEEGVPGRETFGSMPQTPQSASEGCLKISREMWVKTPSLALDYVDCQNPTPECRCILVATNAWHRPFASLLRRPLGVVVRAAEER